MYSIYLVCTVAFWMSRIALRRPGRESKSIEKMSDLFYSRVLREGPAETNPTNLCRQTWRSSTEVLSSMDW